MADEMSPGLAAELEARSGVGQCEALLTDPEGKGEPFRCIRPAGHDGLHDTGLSRRASGEDGALVTKLRLAKTDCRIALQSVSRAQGELAEIVAGWASFRDLGDARQWLEGLEATTRMLERLVQWARGCEDEVLVRMNGRGNV